MSSVAPSPPEPGPTPRSIQSTLLGGASALGAVSIVERGCNFAANLLAARFAGAQVFGAYSLALTTANNVATYAGAGIGTTANRFAGRYRPGTLGHARLIRSLTLVSLASALLAVALLLVGAGPLARILLRNPGLTPLLQLAALSAGLMILLECLRGFLIGERLYRPLAALALCSGAGLVLLLPAAARMGATSMIACQAAVSGLAIAICLAVTRRAPEGSVAAATSEPTVLPSARAIWRFGIVQFAGVIGLNAAGWWVAALVARADTTLAQAGLFAVANQLRNLTSLGPNLLTQSSYALLADDEAGTGRSGAVLVHCTYFAALLSAATAGTLAAVAGWVLPLVFGASFRGATLAASLAMATAVVHMTSSAASARLTIVSLRMTGLINIAWTVLTIAAATWLVPRWGAAAAMGVYFAAHLISAGLVFVALRTHQALPSDLGRILLLNLALGAVLAGLAILRELVPAQDVLVSLSMMGITAAATIALAVYGSTRGWLPRRLSVRHLKALVGRARVRRAA